MIGPSDSNRQPSPCEDVALPINLFKEEPLSRTETTPRSAFFPTGGTASNSRSQFGTAQLTTQY